MAGRKSLTKKPALKKQVRAGHTSARRPVPQRTSNDKTGRLAALLERQLQVQKALYEIADAAGALTDLPSLLARIHKIVGTLMYAENFGVLQYDAATNTRSYPYYADSMGDVPPPPGPVAPQSIIAEVLSHPHTLHLKRPQSEKTLHSGRMFGTPSEDFVGIPLLVDNQVIGGIIVQSYTPEIAYSEEDIRVLEYVARHIAIAWSRARAIQDIRQRNAELQIISSVQNGLASRLDMQAIYDLVGDKIRAIFDAHAVLINTYDYDAEMIRTDYLFNEDKRDYHGSIPFTRFARYLIDTRQPLVFNDDFERRHAEIGMDAPPGVTKLPKSGVWAPLISGDTVRGVVSVYNNDRENAFPDSDVRLLQTLTNSMSLALENARLFDELQRRNQELTESLEQQTATSEVLKVISRSAFDLHPVFETIVERAAILCGADHAWVGRFVEDGILLDAYRGPSDEISRLVGTVRTFNEPLRQLRLGSETINLDDALADPVFSETVLVQVGRMRGYLIVPLRHNGKAIGSFILSRSQPGRFSARQVQLVETFADQAVIAIENVGLFAETQRLLEETEQRNAELQVINSVQEGLASRLEIQAIYDLVGDKLREIFTEHDVTINSYDHVKRLKYYHYSTDRGRRDPIASRPMDSSDDYFIRLRGPRLMNEGLANILATQFPDVQPYFGDFPLSYLSAPMMRGGEVSGYISLQNTDRENAFSDSNVRLLQTLANSMSVALENARLWEQETLYRKALQRELEIGREIQAGFLPETLPLAEGWEIAAALLPAREVAGDFYDAFELPDGNIGLVIADVCDKGVGAALFMTLIRSLIRITSNQEYFEHREKVSPQLSAAVRIQRAVSLTNNYIAESHERSAMFTTLFFGILDPRSGKLTYANAGHEPPYIIRPGRLSEVLRRTGPAVGAMGDREFGVLQTQLQAGDVFFAYTDGVPDCQNPQGEFFGRDRLLALLQGGTGSSYELVKTLEADLHEYANGATQFDDITLLTVRRAGELQAAP